ncbi:MAG: hypothetical protein ACFN9G_07175, partial [Cardiobacterium sp.]
MKKSFLFITALVATSLATAAPHTIQNRRIGQNGGCFRGHCFYRTKWRLSAFFDREIILYKPYLIYLSHPVMTPQ